MALRQYKVKPGCRHGVKDLGPGETVVMEEAHAQGFLDKLEPQELVAAADVAAEDEPQPALAAPAPQAPGKQK